MSVLNAAPPSSKPTPPSCDWKKKVLPLHKVSMSFCGNSTKHHFVSGFGASKSRTSWSVPMKRASKLVATWTLSGIDTIAC